MSRSVNSPLAAHTAPAANLSSVCWRFGSLQKNSSHTYIFHIVNTLKSYRYKKQYSQTDSSPQDGIIIEIIGLYICSWTSLWLLNNCDFVVQRLAKWRRWRSMKWYFSLLFPCIESATMPSTISFRRYLKAFFTSMSPVTRCVVINGARLWLGPKVHKVPHYAHNYHAIPMFMHGIGLPLASHWQHSFVQNTAPNLLRLFSAVCRNSKDNISWTVLPLLSYSHVQNCGRRKVPHTSQLVRPMVFPSFGN